MCYTCSRLVAVCFRSRRMIAPRNNIDESKWQNRMKPVFGIQRLRTGWTGCRARVCVLASLLFSLLFISCNIIR